MADEITPQADAPFDFNEFRKNKMEGTPQPVPGQPAPVVEIPKVEARGEENMRESRRDRRESNKEVRELREQLAKQQGQLEALLTLRTVGDQPPAAKVAGDAEPLRANFATEAEYAKAIGRWEAKQEMKQMEVKRVDEAQQQAFISRVRKADEETAKIIPTLADWEEVRQQAIDENIQISDVTLQTRVSVNPNKALLYYHFVKHPEVLEELEALGKTDIGDMIAELALLDKEVKVLYTPKQDKPEEKRQLSAAESDARKPKPTEAVAPKGGTATDGTISQLLADGRTLNPQWIAKRNAERGIRQ